MFNVVSAFLGEIFPYDLEGGIGIIGGEGWSGFSSLEDDLDKFSFVFSVAVVGKPVVEILAAYSPTMCYSF